MGSMSDAFANLANYITAVASNAKACAAADDLKARIEAANLGSCTIDVSWCENGGATVQCSGKLNREAEMRKLLHEVAEAHGLILTEPQRRDSLATYGLLTIDYGALKLSISPDGATCKRVQVGTRLVPEREEGIYEIVCEEEKPAS